MLERLRTLLRANLATVLLESTDPEDAVAHYLAEVDGGLVQAKDAVASAVAQGRQIERRIARATALSAKWDAKTDAALRAGDEAEAREALRRKLASDRAIEELRTELERQRGRLVEMRATLHALEEKAEEIRRRRDIVAARHRPAVAGGAVRRAAQPPHADKAGRDLAESAERAAVREDLLQAAREVEETGLEVRLTKARQELAAKPGEESDEAETP